MSKSLLAALRFRDSGQCQFPGCTHTRWLQAHHVRHWLRGGRTDLDNLVLLCGGHHTLVHDHGYRITGRGNRLRFARPDGRAISSAGPPTWGNTATLTAENPPVGDDPLTPTWAGEPLDPTSIMVRLLPNVA